MAQASKEKLSSKPFTKGLVQVFTGKGKGKTTGALGTAIRALGHGFRVNIIVFMKGDYPYGEWNTLSKLPNIDFARFGSRGFVDRQNISSKDREQAEQALAAAREAMLSGNYDLVVLDEVNVAAAWGLVGLDKVIELINEKPKDVELILTGREADTKLIELADMVTECVDIKHPYKKGIKARRGIEY
jgi:cob(I)alamin adenosyltransferase